MFAGTSPYDLHRFLGRRRLHLQMNVVFSFDFTIIKPWLDRKDMGKIFLSKLASLRATLPVVSAAKGSFCGSVALPSIDQVLTPPAITVIRLKQIEHAMDWICAGLLLP